VTRLVESPERSTSNRIVSLCPACRSTSYKSTGPEALGFTAVAGDEEFRQENYCIRECANCGLLYRTPTLSQNDLDRYYAKTDFRQWEIAGYYPTERRVLEILRKLPRGSRILDFGCSSGRLLAELTGEYDCFGVEVNEAAAAEAAKKGLKILAADDLESAKLPKFDVITLVDLIEHIADPFDLLRRLSRLLADDGVIIIVTGNGDAAACRRDPAQFWYLRTVEHLSMLTRKCAEFLSSNLGLRLERWIELSHYDLSFREKLVQVLQNFAYWQFRRRTLLAQVVLQLMPGMDVLKSGVIAPTYSCSRDHVVAVFRK
jgi:SAM-dependent methyltransferase